MSRIATLLTLCGCFAALTSCTRFGLRSQSADGKAHETHEVHEDQSSEHA